MEGSASLINSRATAIKTILLAAWREKLSNEVWESRIRKILPRGVNGDVYDLADCLLKQALVGPVPNPLFMSYMKHAVECELISHGAVLTSIAQQPTNIRLNSLTPNRTSSVYCLLEFLKTFRSRISCGGTEVECLNLCYSLSLLMQWLLKCVLNSLESIQGASTTQQASPSLANLNLANTSILGSINTTHESILGIIDLCTEAIHYFTSVPFTRSLLFISKLEYVREFNDIFSIVQTIQQKLSNCPNLRFIQERAQHYKILQQININFNSRDMHPSVVAAQQLRCLQVHRIRSTYVTSGCKLEKKVQQSLPILDSTTNHALFNSLYSLIAFDVVLRAARPHRLLAKQISAITNFNSAPISMTYCEIIRVCMIGLIDAEGANVKVKWSFFTFLKLPKLLISLSKIHDCYSAQESTNNHIVTFINDLRLAFERLCEYSPLLDELEFKCNCDIFKCLVKELIKNEPNLMQLKNMDFRKFSSKRILNSTNDNSVGGHLILKAEPVVTTMLATFDTATEPIQLYSILCQLIEGKQFEFTLNAAASSGRLHMFVKKLVEHNELNRIPRNDSPKSPLIQALIFDITFLMLTYIAQQYGPDVIGSEQQTTFNKWFYDSYNPCTRINCPKEMLKDCNGEVVSSLIKQMVNPELGLQMKSVNWREVCINLPKAINEILVAWAQGYLSDNHMRGIIERIRSGMCFVAVVAAAWLQCHIRTLNEADKAKPLSLLQNLTKASHQAKHQEQISFESRQRNEGYTERSSVMCSIIRKIYFELVPKPSQTNSSNNSSEETIDEQSYHSTNDKFISTITTQDIFLTNVKACLNRGWIDHKSLNSLNSLFKMIGSERFTNFIVEQILTSHESPSDLSRAVDITFGLFHLDIEACAFALLKNTIPSWLLGEKKQVLLNQPRAFTLAHLTVMTIIEVFNILETSQSKNADDKKQLTINGVKQEPGEPQQPNEVTATTNGPRDVKRIKLTHDVPEKDHHQDVAERLKRLNNCIADLMRLFKEIMSDSVMSQRTLFPVLFLQQTVVCTREGSTLITVHLQPEILLDIINLFSSELTFELVLAISNLSTTNSRSFAAKAMCQLAQVKESKQNQSALSQPSSSNSSKSSTFNHSSNSGAATSNKPTLATPMVIG